MDKTYFIQQFQHIRRPKQEQDYPLIADGRPAAVLVPLITRATGLTVLLTQRARHLKHHPGQISFPGGGLENADLSLHDTALRESEEEIGLNRKHVDIIGQMEQYRTISGYTITPVIGFVEPLFSLVLDANEVDHAFEVPLAFLLDRKNHFTHQIKRQGQAFPVYFIPYQDYLIWGATAALLRNLSFHIHP